MDFVAIDFETASGNANSACQVAAVVVHEGEIVEERSWLIRPPRMYFSPRNIAVHGIRPRQVVDAPTMEQVWSSLSALIDGHVVVAHNARFDIQVLLQSLAAYDVACPPLEFTCTRLLARCAWPGRSRYGLKPLGTWLGIDFQHHDALEDARCCAKIALAAASTCEADSLSSLEQKLRVTRGGYQQGKISGPHRLGRRRSESTGGRTSTDRWGFPNSARARRSKAAAVDAMAILAASADTKPLAGKKIVLLGPLRGLSTQESAALVASLGGTCQNQISAETDFVVACGTSLEAASHLVCQSLVEAPHSPQELSSVGGIRLLSERQFRALLPGGKAATWG